MDNCSPGALLSLLWFYRLVMLSSPAALSDPWARWQVSGRKICLFRSPLKFTSSLPDKRGLASGSNRRYGVCCSYRVVPVVSSLIQKQDAFLLFEQLTGLYCCYYSEFSSLRQLLRLLTHRLKSSSATN